MTIYFIPNAFTNAVQFGKQLMRDSTFFLQFVNHGDVVEGDKCQHAVLILSRKALL